MSEKTSEIHRLGDHVFHNGTPAPSGTDPAFCAANPQGPARAGTGEHVAEKTEPGEETGSADT